MTIAVIVCVPLPMRTVRNTITINTVNAVFATHHRGYFCGRSVTKDA
jgi:hypothetical protein